MSLLNETWLDKSIKSVSIDGYVCVGRRDRKSGQKCGGIATYARSGLATQITLLEDSMSAERQWLLIHADQGPILLCNWYRPPDDATSVETLEEEWQRHAEVALKRIIVGDLNLHQRSWLRHSSGDTPLGKEMHEKVSRMGLSQIVKEPTRNDHLLDLVLTDCEDVTAAVCGKITDHRLVLTTMRARIPECKVRERTVWDFKKADWAGLEAAVRQTEWSGLLSMTADEGAVFLTDTLMRSLFDTYEDEAAIPSTRVEGLVEAIPPLSA